MKDLPIITEKNVSLYCNKPEVIQQLIEQMKKDFDWTDLSFILSDQQELYQNLVNLIKPFISKLIDDNYQKLLELLYRIDINEKVLAETINTSDKDNLAEEITKLIILRELQKVVRRNYYK